MSDILYTDTNKIRAALGVSDAELFDEQIVDNNCEIQLSIDLQNVYPDHAALHTAVNGGSPTTEQVFLNKALILYSQYACAVFMTPQLQMITAQKITDGDFEMQRFQKDNIADTIARITAQRDKYGKILSDAAGITTAGAFISLLAKSSPGYDPVLDA